MSKKLVWINEDVAKRLQFVGDTVNLSETEIKRIIDDLRQEITLMDEALEQDAVSFRHHAQRVRNSYKQVADEEVMATQELWESLDAVRCETEISYEDWREICITPEMPYCPWCEYGRAEYPNWVETIEDTYDSGCEWVCTLKESEE